MAINVLQYLYLTMANSLEVDNGCLWTNAALSYLQKENISEKINLNIKRRIAVIILFKMFYKIDMNDVFIMYYLRHSSYTDREISISYRAQLSTQVKTE